MDYKELRRLAIRATQSDWPFHESAFQRAASPSVVLALLEEIEGLRKDAERYRWLRGHGFIAPTPSLADVMHDGDDAEIDAAIDAAMSPQEKEEGK